MTLSDHDRAIKQRLKDDFTHYAPRALKIRTKQGAIEPLSLNRAQLHIHERLEHQLATKGKVRAIILKGRQQGCSTYTEGRYYWKVTHRKGVRAFILTHEQEATSNLFEMVQRYHEYCHSMIKPHTSASNAKELVFDKLDSGYKLGTAGTKGTGRSSTIQFFHGSEVAFWPHADEHAQGVMQAIPDAPGTEVILESTANGIGNYFHRIWQQAESGMSDYEPIFIPWFWQTEYSRPVPPEFHMTPEEAEYAETYGVTPEQITWLRAKLADLKGDWALFHQEYPATPALAFQTSGVDSFIHPAIVMKARKAKAREYGVKVGGLDPARFGDDRTSYIQRQGRKAWNLKSWAKKDTMEVAGLAAMLIKSEGLQKLFIDVGGLGAGVVDRLREMGLGDKIVAVNSGEKPLDNEKYYNKRAEMWGVMNDWLHDEPVEIPDSDELHGDLVGVSYSYDSNTRLKLEKKEDMKKRGLRSPDTGDALALTFAFPIMGEVKTPKANTGWVV